ncbi:MAG: protein kinase, partial [Gemmatimonadales bacterium]
LQHPHILPLFDSGTAGGPDDDASGDAEQGRSMPREFGRVMPRSFLYYVMPFIDGETLRDKLNRETQLGIDEAVRITCDVADALDYAHQQGVIHRDIKPENILLHDGRPMVADFGIALAVSAAAGGRMTETGLSLGTPHYMSPEQATAEKDLTNRSDIYSLGSVLYEMLTGEPPHTGSSAQMIISKVVTEDPRPVAVQRKTVPPHVASAVHRALEKLPADRFVSAAAFAEALTNPMVGAVSLARPVANGAQARALRWQFAVAGVVLLAVGVVVGRVSAPAGGSDIRPARLGLNTPETDPVAFSNAPIAAVSPDGRYLVYVSGSGDDRQLVSRPLESQTVSRIAGTSGASSPFFSPGGDWIGYFHKHGIRRVRLTGGTPVSVVDDASNFRGATWSPGGEILYGRAGPVWQERAGPLWAVHADGSTAPRLVAAPDTTRSVWGFWLPDALPDGQHAVVTLLGATLGRWQGIAVIDLDSGEWSVVIPPPAFGGRYDPSGHLIYTMPGGALQAIPFDAGRLEVTGPAATLADGVHRSSWSIPQLAISRQGTLVYIGEQPHELALVDHDGASNAVAAVSRIFHHPRFSPDGRRVAVDIARGGKRDVWIQSLDQGTLTRVTFEGNANDPIWTPDGRRITYASAQSGTRGIYETSADGSGTPDSLLTVAGSNTTAGFWTPRGDRLIAIADAPSSGLDLLILERDSPNAEPLVATPFDDAHPALSPDGRWLAYVSNQSGQSEVVVRSFPKSSTQVQISVAGGTEPVWGPNGRQLYYRAAGETEGPEMVVARVESGPDFRVVSRERLFSADQFVAAPPHANYDVAPDGSGFVMVRIARAKRFEVLLNWPEELHRR